MDLGLGNLTELKAHLLNEALRSDTRFDAAIAALGKGIAARFESYCQRKFARLADDTFDYPAERESIALPRYPIEEITRIEIRSDLATGWVEQDTVETLVEQIMEAGGVVIFKAPLGVRPERARLTYTGGYWYRTAEARTLQRGTVSIPSGGSAAAVAFATAFAEAPTVVVAVLAPDGGAILTGQANDITAVGFIAVLSAPAPASGYSIAWTAIAPAEDETDVSEVQSGSEACTLGAESLAVVFSEAFDAAPVVICNLVAPDGLAIVAAQPAAVTAAGFTAQFGAPLPSGDYELAWVALAPGVESIGASTIPDGATALPDDLKLAWLLQCERVWQLRDKLGVSVAETARNAADLAGLTAMQLVPEVEAILRHYRRYSLL